MIWIMIIMIVALALIGVPMSFSMLTGSVWFMLTSGMPQTLMIQRLIMAVGDSFSMLAIPFFMLAGTIMNAGGVATRIFDFCNTLVGHIPGGLGHVNVFCSVIFAGMSGSAVADAGGLADLLLFHGVGAQYRRFLLALGDKDLAPLLALRQQYRFTLLAFGLHLAFHRRHYLLRRDDVFDLYAVHFDAPFVGGLVERLGDAGIDMVARRQREIQLHRADDVPQRRRGEVLYRGKRVLYAVSQHLGVRHLKKDDGVYLHRDVIFRDHRLRHEVDDLLLDGEHAFHDAGHPDGVIVGLDIVVLTLVNAADDAALDELVDHGLGMLHGGAGLFGDDLDAPRLADLDVHADIRHLVRHDRIEYHVFGVRRSDAGVGAGLKADLGREQKNLFSEGHKSPSFRIKKFGFSTQAFLLSL